MTRALLLLFPALAGCFVVPTTKTTTRSVGTETGAATLTDAVAEVELDARFADGEVEIEARRRGDCTQPVYTVHEVTRRASARIGGVSDPRGVVFGALLAPVTIPLSAAITGLLVAASSDETSRVVRPAGHRVIACTRRAGALPVSVTLPSGAIVRATTDATGRARIAIPDTEPYEGRVQLAAEAARPMELSYALPRPAVTTARDALVSCAARQHLDGEVTLNMRVDARGKPSRLSLSAGDGPFRACVSEQLRGVTFPPAMRGASVAMPISLPSVTAALP